jgi:type IV secretory pathway VirB10-like protein
MSEKIKAVEKMISKVMRKRDLTRAAAIHYMLIIATGRLAALWRYENTLPDGKVTKGILTLAGRKKRAPKTPKIAAAPSDLPRTHPKAAKPAPKPKAKRARKPKAEQVVESEAAE